MANLLCLETSTTNCSVAISKDDELLALVEEDRKNYSHAEQLHIFIDKAMNAAGITYKQLDAIAVSKGPGSYTGLRIGVSTAKGLSYSLGIPLISVSTLQSLAAQVKDVDIVIPMIDARRMEVYTQTFNREFEPQNNIEAKILDKSSFYDELNHENNVCFIGNGVAKFEEISNSSDHVRFIHSNPSAKQMIPIAHKKNKQHQFEDVAYFEPFYLKEFIGGKNIL